MTHPKLHTYTLVLIQSQENVTSSEEIGKEVNKIDSSEASNCVSSVVAVSLNLFLILDFQITNTSCLIDLFTIPLYKILVGLHTTEDTQQLQISAMHVLRDKGD